MNGHPCNRLAVSPLVPIMVQRLNGTGGAKSGKSATKDTGVPRLTSGLRGPLDRFHAITP
jgi:hypothetical protein